MRAWLATVVAAAVAFPAVAAPRFTASEIQVPSFDLFFADLDGDGLRDMVALDHQNRGFSVFYQGADGGFGREPQQRCVLENPACIVWAARLRAGAESLLVMTSNGVAELSFTNRTAAPVRRGIIHQQTLIPADVNRMLYLPFSIPFSTNRALVLVPAVDGLQVWSDGSASGQSGEWRRAQLIRDAIGADQRPLWPLPGYRNTIDLDFSVADLNGDGRDDLVVRQSQSPATNVYSVHLQQPDGRLGAEPAMVCADHADPFSWLCWADLNHDGKPDLVRGVWLNEPSLIPGVPSGKVLVSTYLADAQGRIPKTPTQVFRKNDWLAAVPVMDLDGDGIPDLALGYVPMDSRESLRKEITARKLEYDLRFHFGRPDGTYPEAADCERRMEIHLDRAAPPLDWSLPQTFQRSFKLEGDFNGDGTTDLLVRDRRDEISVYFFVSREKGYSIEPGVRFHCPEPIEDWLMTDLNGDGISDLVVKLENGIVRTFVSHR